ncbi:MAG: trypsin-like serine peptidase [Thermoanaerobaculia bacterium]
MKRLTQWGCVLAVSLLAVPSARAVGRERVTETLSERPGRAFDAAGLLAKQLRLHGLLVDERAEAGLERAITVNFSPAELAALREPEGRERKLLVGVSKPVHGAAFNFAGYEGSRGRARAMPYGAIRDQADGGFSWTTAVRVPGATAVRLRFDRIFLPGDHELYVYSEDGQAYGPYVLRGPQGNRDFWSHTVSGDEVIVQLRYRPSAGPRPEGNARFVIREAGYIGDKFKISRGLTQMAAGFCSFNEPCVENVNCTSSPAVADARDAAAHILFRSGGSFFICSGGLLTDTDTNTDRPLFLTANHCISKGREASSMEAFFQFDTRCGGACYDPDGVVPSTVGSSILAKNRTSDYTLLELSESAPRGSAFMGWNSLPVAFSNGTSLFRVSHPAGAPQAYSEHSVDTGAGTCGGWPRGNWIYSADTLGATEGGSSGSPVVNSSGQVVGQLTGACGTNVNDPCDSAANATVDGAFAAYFPSIESILDPGSGGTCTLGQVGDPCNSNGDCCSNKCRGRRGSKTCR